MDVQAFSIKEGPTESGALPVIKKIMFAEPIGGELLPFNLLETFPRSWILFFVMFLPLFLLIYKKRDLARMHLSK